MKWINPIILILILTTCLPVVTFGELNKSQDEDTQTLVVEIVDKKVSDGFGKDTEKGGRSRNKFSLPQTSESKVANSALGIGLCGMIIGVSLLIYKRGGGKHEAK